MNHMCAALELAELIVDLTDPKITRWRREQIEAQARIKARSYIQKLKEQS